MRADVAGMSAIAAIAQRNPSLVLLVLVGLPSLTWAAAYGRRPSRARLRVAIVALVATGLVALAAVVEAMRVGERWWLPLVGAGGIAVSWALLVRRARC